MPDKKSNVKEETVIPKSQAALDRFARRHRPRYGREKAEKVVRKVLGIKAKDDLPMASIRSLLKSGGRAPRHDAMFALMDKFYKEIGFGGISVLHAKRYILSVEDLVNYIANLRVPVE